MISDPATDKQIEQLAHWLGRLEEKMASESTAVVYGMDKRLSVLENVVDRLAKDLHAINQNLGRLVWAVGLTLVAGVVQFVLRGGLNVP